MRKPRKMRMPGILIAGRDDGDHAGAWTRAMRDFRAGDRGALDDLLRVYRARPALVGLIGEPPPAAIDAERSAPRTDGRTRNHARLSPRARDDLMRKARALHAHYHAGLGAIRQTQAELDVKHPVHALGWGAVDQAQAVREVRKWYGREKKALADAYGVSVATVEDYMRPSRSRAR